jgi:predicted nuclease with TOPRIM domain
MKTLFDNSPDGAPASGNQEEVPVDRLKDLETKISNAIEKVKSLKQENTALQSRVRELEDLVAEKDAELRDISSEKSLIKGQILDLLDELETIETVQQ